MDDASAGEACAERAGVVVSTRTCRRPAGFVAGLAEALQRDGFVHVPAGSLAYVSEQHPAQVHELQQSWDRLGPDDYLEGPKFRRRRYAMYRGEAATGDLVCKPHGPHFQRYAFNPVFGDQERWFEPLESSTVHNPVLRELAGVALDVFAAAEPPRSAFHVEAHQFRIEPVGDGVGQPPPEGVHRDGRDWVAIFMIARANVAGGETLVCDAATDGELARVTLTDAFEALLVNDHTVKHGVSGVRNAGRRDVSHRDVLVVTFIDEDAAAGEVSKGD